MLNLFVCIHQHQILVFLSRKEIYSKVALSDNSSIGKILLKTLSKPFCNFDVLSEEGDKNC